MLVLFDGKHNERRDSFQAEFSVEGRFVKGDIGQ